MRNVDKTTCHNVATLGYYSAGDGGNSEYWYDSSDTTSTDNGGTVVVGSDGGRWKIVDSDTVTLRQFGARGLSASVDTAAFQTAVNSLRKNIVFDTDLLINTDISLVANQTINFAGYKITVPSGSTITNAVLYANTKSKVKIISPEIDGAAITNGVVGIYFNTSPDCSIAGDINFNGAFINLTSSNSNRMNYKIDGGYINGNGSANGVGVYVSGCRRAKIKGLEITNTKEGFGVYNGAKQIKYTDCEAYSNTMDGFVIISGTNIEYKGCESYSNGQSGFTTQRQTAGTNTLRVQYIDCVAHSNTYDGFDLRGANSTPWGVPINISATGCISYSNSGTGFYVVNAEDTTLTGCVAYGNTYQNYAIQSSNRTILEGCRSQYGASGVSSGTSKAGILFQDSSYCQANACVSTNDGGGANQQYGISFIGTSQKGHVNGGWFVGTVAGWNMGDNGLHGAGPGDLEGVGVFLDYRTWTNTFLENGFNPPTHTRPSGSMYRRMSGTGELYISQGGGTWTRQT